MPIPASINDLSTTAGSNSPAGSESPSLLDDYLRTYASYIALLRDGFQFTGANQSLATPGYQRLPGGLILQFGFVSGFSGYTITLPFAFPTGVLGQPIACCVGTTTASAGACYAETSAVSSNSFKIFTYFAASGGGASNNARAAAWFCLGY